MQLSVKWCEMPQTLVEEMVRARCWCAKKKRGCFVRFQVRIIDTHGLCACIKTRSYTIKRMWLIKGSNFINKNKWKVVKCISLVIHCSLELPKVKMLLFKAFYGAFKGKCGSTTYDVHIISFSCSIFKSMQNVSKNNTYTSI